MQRKFAIGALSLMVLLAAAIVSWSEEGAPQAPDPGQGQHQFGGGGRRQWGGSPGQFGGQGGRGYGGGERLLRMADNPRVREYLGLTDEQVGRLHTLGVDAEKASVQARADMELRHIELRELLKADNPDRAAIMQKLDEANALRGKMEKQRVETLLSARSVLTPEQQKKVKTFMQNRGAGEGMQRGHRMERRGAPGRSPGPPGGPGVAPGGSTPKSQEPPVQ